MAEDKINGNEALTQNSTDDNKNTAVKYYKKACELGKNDSEAQNPSNKDFWQLACELYERLK